MDQGVIYYTDNRLGDPLYSLVQKHISESGLPITSSSLKPISFGDNEVMEGQRSYPTMVKQITSCLERSPAKYVFFCEHDVLYSKSHFDFVPPKDDIFYYNENVWRWWTENDYAIRYERMLPLSCLCVNREFALDHYLMRQRKIEEWGLDEFRSREPRLARLWGYEPGTKKKRRGGLTDDDFDTWASNEPVIDVRHKKTFSSPKINLEDFKHAPEGWVETPIDELSGWNLKEIYGS
ncbi:hypothetical protein KKH13_05360 [Patescibacteria group bacterium]|nr:hypothetical protein [Patescibacteria group bacterium]